VILVTVKCEGGEGEVEFPSRAKLEETFKLFVSFREEFGEDEVPDVSKKVDCKSLEVTHKKYQKNGGKK